MTLPHVAIGVDGSLLSVRALDRAADEAARRRAELRVVYAVSDRDEAGPILASAVTRVHERHPDLRVMTKSVEGPAAKVLTEESGRAALTVVGTRGLGGVAGTLLGSVSLRLAAHAHGPLMVVREDHRCYSGTAPWAGGPAVLLGLESDTDVDAAVYAFAEAERRGARLRVLHAQPRRHGTPELPSLISATSPGQLSPGQQRRAQRDRAEAAVPRFSLARLREHHPTVGVHTRTVRSGPSRALLEATRQAAVVVIGAHRRKGHVGLRLGPVAHTLLHRSHCPVVLVPATR
ncbi:universal stress protein [Streptomyces sp. NPDC101175]|uniref:universal stress protein n=1 Tax=Streptomyces sp. NPDC101175 TaxID=3366123 RepID=UPI0038341F2A